MDSYALLLSDLLAGEVRELARHIAEQTERTLFDVTQQVYYGRGLLAERLTGEEVQALGGRLAAAGWPTFAVPETALVAPVRPLRVTKAAVTPDGFVIEDQLQRLRTEPWHELRLLCAGTVQADEHELPTESARRAPARPKAGALTVPGEGVVLRLGDDDDEVVERRHYLDLLFCDAAPRHYRIDAGTFNYQYLAGAGRLGLRRDENLMRLASDLVAQGGAGWVTPAVRKLADGRLEPTAVVPALRLYDAEVRWRWQRLRAFGAPSEAM